LSTIPRQPYNASPNEFVTIRQNGAMATGKANRPMTDLANQSCVPCQGGVPPLSKSSVDTLLTELDGWAIHEGHHLTKSFTFEDFEQALAFVNRVGEIAEHQAHHPNILLTWGRVTLDIWTHKIDGLTKSDFVLAAKADAVYRRSPQI